MQRMPRRSLACDPYSLCPEVSPTRPAESVLSPPVVSIRPALIHCSLNGNREEQKMADERCSPVELVHRALQELGEVADDVLAAYLKEKFGVKIAPRFLPVLKTSGRPGIASRSPRFVNSRCRSAS